MASATTTLAAAGVTGLAALHALTAADALDEARGRLAAVQEGGTSAGQALASLRAADEDLADAEAALRRWPVDVLAAVPVLGRSWAAERAVTGTAREVVDGARVLVEGLPALSAGVGGVDLAAVERLRSELDEPVARSAKAYARLSRMPLGLTPPAVSDGVLSARTALGPAVTALARADQALQVTSGLLGGSGSRSVLVALQNNAELRGTGGYVSSFAVARAEGGRLALGPLQDLIDVADTPAEARTVPAPEEYVEDFAEVGGNLTTWRTWNMSPHVPDSALVGARVAGALLGREPDVVLLLDVPALAALAALGGAGVLLPDGTTVRAEDLADALLVEAYADAGADGQEQARRRERLQAAASAAVGTLAGASVSSSAVATTLAELVAQRHLTVWSAREHEQQLLVELGAAGAVLPPRGGDLFHVSVNNVGGNKLDQYVDRDLALDVVLGPRTANVVQRVRFTNRAPAGLVSYVAGAEPGVVISRVELSLPPAAQDLAATLDGEPWPGELHTGGDRDRLLARLEVPRGGTAELEVRYTLPVEDGRYRLRLIPQPLVEDAYLALRVRAAAGRRLAAVDGATTASDALVESGVLSEGRELAVALEPPQPTSRWDRLQTWWDSPVRLAAPADGQ